MQKIYDSMNSDTASVWIESLNFGEVKGVYITLDDTNLDGSVSTLLSKEDSIALANNILEYWKNN